MLTKKLKTTVKELAQKDRKELSSYMIKLQLEEDPEYWNRIRKRTANYHPSNCKDISQAL